MNAKQDYALAVLTKQAALSAEDWRTIGTYAVPTLAGAGIGALAYRKNRLLGALLGGGAGAGLGALADYGYKKYLESLPNPPHTVGLSGRTYTDPDTGVEKIRTGGSAGAMPKKDLAEAKANGLSPVTSEQDAETFNQFKQSDPDSVYPGYSPEVEAQEVAANDARKDLIAQLKKQYNEVAEGMKAGLRRHNTLHSIMGVTPGGVSYDVDRKQLDNIRKQIRELERGLK